MNTEKKKINIKFNVLAIIAIIILCFAISPKTLQNDTFYTIKIGELILNNGIDMCDHFSWHENLPYTYPHWAYDTGIYLIYNLGELTGIENGGMLFIYLSTVILACILGILIYYINNKLTKNKLVSFFISMFAIYLLRDFIAARAQLVTFILFALTVLFIENFLETKKKIYLLGMIIISIAIANIHVAVWPFFFVLFLPYIVEYIIASIAEKNVISRLKVLNKKSIIKNIEKQLNRQVNEKKIEKLKEQLNKAKEELIYEEEKLERVKQTSDNLRQKPYKIKVTKNKAVKWIVLVMIICAFTGLLTPLGDAPYTYLAKTMQGNTTASISEHLPLTLYNNKEAMVTLALFFIMLIFTDVKIKLSDLFMLAGLIYLSFMSRRQVSLLVLIGGFIFSKLLKYLTEKYDLEGCERFTKFMTTIIGKACTIIIVALVAFSLYKPKRKESSYEPPSFLPAFRSGSSIRFASCCRLRGGGGPRRHRPVRGRAWAVRPPGLGRASAALSTGHRP